MAITTYAELQTSIADFLNRDDLASVTTSFISLAEADMQRQAAPLAYGRAQHSRVGHAV